MVKLLWVTKSVLPKEAQIDLLLKFSLEIQGIGISEEASKTLLMPLCKLIHQLQENLAEQDWGLRFVQKLAKAMNGTVYFESELGKGSTFYFEVDLEKGTNTFGISS